MAFVPDGLSAGQRRLLADTTAYLEADPRVEGAWLVGSLAHGAGDRFSDVDLVAAVAERALAGVVEEWPARAASLVDLAFSRPVASSSTGTTFTHVASDYVRFDVTFATTKRALESGRGGIPLLTSSSLDPDRAAVDGRAEATAHRVQHLSEEFLRVLGLLPVVIGREEYLVAASGGALLRSLLMDLFRELGPPGYRGGAMRLERTLSRDQLETLRGLPPLLWTRDPVIDLHLSCARHFLPAARQTYSDLGLVWPQAFEDAVRLHLDRELGIALE